MTDGSALLAAVIADPDDDAVRLVYSDWLEENGDEAGRARAEFIRVQIRRESLLEDDPQWTALLTREKELLAKYAEEWLRPVPEWARTSGVVTDAWYWFGFRRGFLQGVHGVQSATQFLRDAPSLFAIEPVTHLYLGDRTFLPALAHSAEFLSLLGLRFGHYVLGDSGAVTLSGLPPLPRLRQLGLYKNEINNRGLKALAQWPGLATVEELDLGWNHFQATGVKALLASPYLGKLKHLDLSDSSIATKTKKALQDRFGAVVEV
jgi:uncharacterized protein (TIGR02996 family)